MKITIDGPAGAGKSTAARKLAARLGIAFLDTGATYRAVTLKALREEMDLADPAALADLARGIDLRLEGASDGLRVWLDGQDVSEDIRDPKITAQVHHVASPPQVREVMVQLQRRIGRQLGDFVTEGRDQGSVVFPDADVKFYLDPDPAIRAQRRWEELQAKGHDVTLEQVRREMDRRDLSDRQRSVGPLIQPQGAIVVDNARLTPDQTTDRMMAAIQQVQR